MKTQKKKRKVYDVALKFNNSNKTFFWTCVCFFFFHISLDGEGSGEVRRMGLGQ